jgi:hypothetical protein
MIEAVVECGNASIVVVNREAVVPTVFMMPDSGVVVPRISNPGQGSLLFRSPSWQETAP